MKNIFLIIILITTQSIFAASYNKPSASKLYKEAVELVKKEQFESAIKKLTKYTKKKPKDSDGWTLLAFSNRKISEFDKAKEFYEKAISIDETDGLSLSFKDWRFNLRKSNNEPLVRLNIEARGNKVDIQEKLENIKSMFI